MNVNKRKFMSVILFICSLIYILGYFHVATTFDEKYTLLLVSHKFSRLIYLDSLDVHPPLYYLILKYFLIITTFWTKSFFIKVIFARILSLLFSMVTIFYIFKTFRLFNIDVHLEYQWILFILLPNVLCSYNPYSLQPMVNIRMYSLASMIIAIEFYCLNKINKKSDLTSYINIILLSSLAMYTHYFAAFISIMMLITFIIKFRYNKNIVKKLFYTLIISCLLYLPWLPYFYRQISIPSSQTFYMSRIGTFARIIIFVGFCIIIGYPIIWSKNHLNNTIQILSDEILGTLSLTLLFLSTVLLIIRPMFNLRYMYPIFIIYEMYSFTILIKYILKNKSSFTKLYEFTISLALLLNLTLSFYYQVRYIDLPDIKINRNISNICKSRKKNIKLNSKYSQTSLDPTIKGKNHQFEIDKTPINFEYAFFLSYNHKDIYTNGLHKYFAINKKPAYKPLFRNIELHIK